MQWAIAGNAFLGVFVIICVTLCVQGCSRYPEKRDLYVISLLVMLTVMFVINEGCSLSVWKWRANPRLAQNAAYIRGAAKVAGAATSRVSSGLSSF